MIARRETLTRLCQLLFFCLGILVALVQLGVFPLYNAKSTVVSFLDLTIKIDKGRVHSLTSLHNNVGSVVSTRNANRTIKHKPTFKVTNSEGYIAMLLKETTCVEKSNTPQ